MTSKLQVTVPKTVADRFGIRPGDQIEWAIEGDAIRVRRVDERRPLDTVERLALFDEATREQQQRNRVWRRRQGTAATHDRGWTRGELYTRGRPR